MVDSVVVTVYADEPWLEADMELPANVPIHTLCEQLLEVLKVMDSNSFDKVIKIHLEYENFVLADGNTLAESNVWDGSYLKVVVEVQRGRY